MTLSFSEHLAKACAYFTQTREGGAFLSAYSAGERKKNQDSNGHTND